MEIFLRQHQDGSFFLEVLQRGVKKEVDVTKVIDDVVVDRLKNIQEKLNLEEKYRNWILDSAQKHSKSVSLLATRYENVLQRLKATNLVISRLTARWSQGKTINKLIKIIEQTRAQNEHFLENDSTLKKIPKD